MSTPTPAITITRRLEFDAGHRIPHHDGQCRHLHGHRYAIELTVSGDVLETAGETVGETAGDKTGETTGETNGETNGETKQ